MKQLEPGMLALVINDQFMENVGRVVTVKEFRGRVTSTAHYGRSYDDGWLVEVYHADQPLKVVHADTGEIFYIPGGITSARNLMPLGDEDTQKVMREAEQGVSV